MILDALPRAVVCALSAFVLFYAPGRALLGRGAASSLPALFSQVLVSVIVTTLAGTGLAAVERFSLWPLFACNLIAAGTALLVRRFSAGSRESAAPLEASRRDLIGPLVFALALAAYWPAYPTFLGSSDSTAYVATGVSLAHHGSLAREDELATLVPPLARPVIFDSMSQVFGSTGPPYRRMPGAMLLESHDAKRAWPDFFPVPSVWAATFVVARAPGGPRDEQAAPGYAPVFAALSLWAFWLLARSWLGAGHALLAVVLLAASAPFYAAARTPLSEPIAGYFLMSGLAVLACGAGRPSRAEALLAGAAFGAAVFTRIETALLLTFAMALLPSLAPEGRRSDARSLLPAPFFVALLGVGSLTIVQAVMVPGTWVLPIVDHVQNAWVRYLLVYGRSTLPLAAAISTLVLVALSILAQRIGWSAMLRWGFVVAVLVGHWAASNFLGDRTSMWLSFYVGWTGLAVAAVGCVTAWRERAFLPAAPLALGLAGAVAAILFYNPHVYPSLPWGARRFVPLLLPLLLLLTCHAAAWAGSRSRLLGLVCVVLVAAPVFAGGRPVWGRNMAEGAWESLAELDAAIPRDGTIFVDRGISRFMVAPALWLVHDRNSITVPPTDGPGSREFLPPLVWYFAKRGPVYFVTHGSGGQTRTPKVRMTQLSMVTLGLRFLEQTYDRRPEVTARYQMPISIYRLDRSLDPLGAPVP